MVEELKIISVALLLTCVKLKSRKCGVVNFYVIRLSVIAKVTVLRTEYLSTKAEYLDMYYFKPV